MAFAKPLVKLMEKLNSLPGIGPKTAQRLAFHLLQLPAGEVDEIARAMTEAKQKIRQCSTCCDLTEQDPCAICSDSRRIESKICVVSDPKDVVALERTREFKGRYHVLHGLISPMDGVGPDDIRLSELLLRVDGCENLEIIQALSPTVEGEATGMYLTRLLKPLGVKVTRLARGIPVGGDLEYADVMTLAKAIEGRIEV